MDSLLTFDWMFGLSRYLHLDYPVIQQNFLAQLRTLQNSRTQAVCKAWHDNLAQNRKVIVDLGIWHIQIDKSRQKITRRVV